MSRFKKLSHTIWHCKYHIVWVPKYRLRILKGEVAEEVTSCIRAFSENQQAEIIELNVCEDHEMGNEGNFTILTDTPGSSFPLRGREPSLKVKK